jgi:hypothetical protein
LSRDGRRGVVLERQPSDYCSSTASNRVQHVRVTVPNEFARRWPVLSSSHNGAVVDGGFDKGIEMVLFRAFSK